MNNKERGEYCDERCGYYHAIDFTCGWCEFSFSHPMGLKTFNQKCDLEDYLNIPEDE